MTEKITVDKSRLRSEMYNAYNLGATTERAQIIELIKGACAGLDGPIVQVCEVLVSNIEKRNV